MWLISTQVSVEQRPPLLAVLSAAERQAHDRIVSPSERARRLGARARTRQILSRYLGCGPGEIALLRDANGRPRIAVPASHGLQFSLSHAGEHALVGVSRHRIGVDIETIDRTFSAERLARRFFAPEEAAWLEQLPAEERTEAVIRLWVLKEAYLKAVGGGVPAGLSRCRIRLDTDLVTVEERTASGPVSPVHLSEISAPPGTRAAVAVTCANCTVECFDLRDVTPDVGDVLASNGTAQISNA